MKTYPNAKLLAERSFKTNRGRNLVAVFAIVLTTLMYAALFVLSQSMSQNMVEIAFRQAGYKAHMSIKNVTDEQIEKLSAHPDVKEIGRSIVIGLAQNSALSGRQAEVRYADGAFYAESSFSLPTTGRLPAGYNEIALDDLVLDRLGIPHELGQTVTLEINNGEETTVSDFILSGFWTGNNASYASTVWVSEAFAAEACGPEIFYNPSYYAKDPSNGNFAGMRGISVMLNSPENVAETVEAIIADTGLSGADYGVNQAYEANSAMPLGELLPMYGGMLLVFIAGYLIIYNVFQISVAADIHFFGQLKTLGASKKQIRRIIFGQALRLSLMGIPAGLVLGYLIGAALVPAMIGVMDNPVVSVSPVIFIGAVLFALLTVFISCLRPARIASRVSPMEAVRYSDAPDHGKRKIKKSKNGASISRMAWANLGRNKKRTVIVVCSLTLGLVLLSAFYANNASFDMEKYLSALMISDFLVTDSSSDNYANGYNPMGTTLTPELAGQINALPGLESTGRVYTSEVQIDLSENALKNMTAFFARNDRLSQMEWDTGWTDDYNEIISTGTSSAVVYGCDGLILDFLADRQSFAGEPFDPELLASGQYVIAFGIAGSGKTEVQPTFSVGEEVVINGKSYTVMGIIEPDDVLTEGAQSSRHSLDFYMPLDEFQKNWPENTLRKLFFNVSGDQTEAAQAFLTDYQQNVDSSMPFKSRQSIIERYEAESSSRAVMGNTVSIVIALVGILNFINSMVTAIISRRREFAMLQSVGMTKRQLRGMLIFEGLDYAALTLVSAYVLGALTVGTVIRSMAEAGHTATFQFTLLPLLACTPVLLVFAVAIPFICFKNLERQNLMERLRNTD